MGLIYLLCLLAFTPLLSVNPDPIQQEGGEVFSWPAFAVTYDDSVSRSGSRPDVW